MRSGQQVRGFRLSRGGIIDRSRTLSFTFDGECYRGYLAIRWPRRCWRTACASSAAPSSITVRVAS